MSTSSDHERELRDALQQQATGVEVVTDFAPKAIARRRRDHRNRIALVATACVAAIAVAVPVLWGANRPDAEPHSGPDRDHDVGGGRVRLRPRQRAAPRF